MNQKSIVALILVTALVLSVSIYVFNRPNLTTSETLQTTNEPRLEHIHGFAVDVSDEERLLIATHHGLLELKQGELSPVGRVTDDLMGFTPHPTDSRIYFSSGHRARGGNLGFQKSMDGGVSWTKLSDALGGPVDFHSMTVSTANPDIVYGHFRTLQRSKDGGLTWESLPTTIQPFMLTAHPENENRVYAATQTGVMVSEDYGETWMSLSAEIASGAVSTFALSPNGNDALVFGETLEGLGRSTDGGKTWKRIGEKFENSPIVFIVYAKNSAHVYAVNRANAIFKSVDGGVMWSKVR